MNLQAHTLSDLLAVSDSGTWGDDGQPGVHDAVLRSTNIQHSKLVLDDVAWRIVPAKDRERRLLKTGDILVTKSSGSPDHIGKCCLFVEPQGGRSYYFSNFMLRLRSNGSKADPRWIFYWLSSSMGRDVLARINNTTTGLRNLDVARYLAQEIPTPSLPEQHRIADILDKADAIRRKRKEAITLTEELLRSAFLEMFGDPVTNPKGWETVGIESLCDVIVDCVNRTAPIVDHETPFKMIRTTNVKAGNVLLDDVRFVTRETFEVWNRRCTPMRNDVLLTREAPVGEAGLLLSDDHVFLGQRLMLYRPNSKLLLPEYLVQAFLGRHMQSQFDVHGSGSTVKHLSLPVCRALSVRLPPYELQQRFAALSRSVRDSLAREKGAYRQTDALFSALVHRAFRGELTSSKRVPQQLRLLDDLAP